LFFGVFLIIILPINYIIYQKIKKILVEADIKELKFEAEKLIDQVRLDPREIPLPKAGFSEKIQLNKEIYFEELFSSPSFPALDQSFYFVEYFQQDTLAFVTVKRKIEYSSSVILLTLMRSNKQLQSSLAELTSYLFYATSASILLAGVFVYTITGFSLSPVMKIVAASTRVNASNSIERVPVPKAKDEYQQLARAINSMLERIELSIKNQTNFFASAAHELKTPLTVMKAELTLALRKSLGSDVAKILDSNLREVERLDHIIHNFLLISQLKTETISLNRKLYGFQEVVFSAMKKIKYLAQDKGSSIQVSLQEEDISADLDFDMMETVVVNLLENAVKYSPYGSVITVQLLQIENRLEVKFMNPILKPLSALDRLKEEFYKAEPQSSGLGLGLWICNRILMMHQCEFSLSQDDNHFCALISMKLVQAEDSTS
jgi:signal transduction histidine kinase